MAHNVFHPKEETAEERKKRLLAEAAGVSPPPPIPTPFTGGGASRTQEESTADIFAQLAGQQSIPAFPTSGSDPDPSKNIQVGIPTPIGDPFSPVTDPITGQQEFVSPDERFARSITARNLALVSQGLGEQRESGLASINRELALRGLGRTGGTRGAFLTRLQSQLGGLASQAAQAAASGEAGILLDLRERARGREFSRQQLEREIQARTQLAQLQAQLQQQFAESQTPSGFESLLGGLGGAVGLGFGVPAGGALFGLGQSLFGGGRRG